MLIFKLVTLDSITINYKGKRKFITWNFYGRYNFGFVERLYYVYIHIMTYKKPTLLSRSIPIRKSNFPLSKRHKYIIYNPLEFQRIMLMIFNYSYTNDELNTELYIKFLH